MKMLSGFAWHRFSLGASFGVGLGQKDLVLVEVVGGGLRGISMGAAEAPSICKVRHASYVRQPRRIDASYICSMGNSVLLRCRRAL